jgi:hypothetical protein
MYKGLLFFFIILEQYISENRISLLDNIFYAYFQAVLSLYCLRLLFQLTLPILVGLGKCPHFFLYSSVFGAFLILLYHGLKEKKKG